MGEINVTDDPQDLSSKDLMPMMVIILTPSINLQDL